MKRLILLCLLFMTIGVTAQVTKTTQTIVRTGEKRQIEYNNKYFDVDTTIITIKVNDIQKLKNNYNVIRSNKLGYIDLLVPANTTIETYVNSISKDANIKIVEYSTVGEYSFMPNDTYLSSQWHLSKINVFDAWNITSGSSNVIVGILDSGTDWEHPELGLGNDGYQNIYLNPNEDIWSNPNNPTTGNGIDDDNNGLIDDWKGWNYANYTNDARTNAYHGTFVAGLVSAKTNNNQGIAGVAGGNNGPGVKILPYCVGVNAPITSILDDAIIDAVDNGAKIIQLSLTVGYADYIEDAIQYAIDNNVVVVCAAGNCYGGAVTYPASNSNVIAVGATNQSDQLAGFSCKGVDLDIVAPGSDIYSTTLNNSYTTSSGTSFAAPITSGVISLLFSVNPNLTVQQARDIIESTAQKVGGYTYQPTSGRTNGTYSTSMGYGMVNAYSAVMIAKCYDESLPIVTGNIDYDDTWENEMYAVGTITVESGYVLTIQSTIRCAPNTKIIVKPGGKLILDGCTLTSSCDDEMWQGIEVWGDPTDISQAANKQGVLEIKNNSLIEHAKCAVYVGDGTLPNTPVIGFIPQGGGGIVTAFNSTFKNNEKAVEFRPYIGKGTWGNYETNNKSIFEKCIFETDPDALFSVNNSTAMVRLYGVRQITFGGCDFIDSKPKDGVSDYGIGIYANNASFSLCNYTANGTQFPITPFIENSFNGFDRAIVIRNSGTRASSVCLTHFENNNVAVYASLANKISIVTNIIDVSPDDYNSGRHGVFIEQSDGYTITNNKFMGDGTETVSGTVTGLRIDNSGEGNNLVNLNTFENMCLAAINTNVNGELSTDSEICTGLQYKCNKFSDNNEDIRINDESNSRIRYMQGTPKIATGNIFDNSVVAIRNISPIYDCLYSFYCTASTPQACTTSIHYPTGYTSIYNVTLKYRDVYSCPIGTGYQGGWYYMYDIVNPPKLELSELAELYSIKTEVLIGKKNSYFTIYDGDVINWSEVTISADGILNNPQAELYVEIVELVEEIQLICNEAFELILSNVVFDYTEYNTWLVRENKVRSDYLLAASYVELGDWDMVKQAMDDLQTRFPLHNTDEYDNYLACLLLQYELYNTFELTEDMEATIEELLTVVEVIEISHALLTAIREYIWGTIYSNTLEDGCAVEFDGSEGNDDDTDDGHKSIRNTQKDIQNIEEKEYTLSVYPNPFDDVIQLHLDNTRDLNIEQIQVYDITGRMLHAKNNINNSQTKILLSDLSTGVYFIHVSLSNGETKVTKVFKQ